MTFPGAAEFPDHQTLRLIRHVNAGPAKVWDAVTVSDQMKDWFYPANFNPAAERAAEGLKFDFEIGWGWLSAGMVSPTISLPISDNGKKTA